MTAHSRTILLGRTADGLFWMARQIERGEAMAEIFADLDRIIVPGLTHWQHPRFFAYFPANSSPAAILGDLISSGIGAQGMIWATSPAVTEVEQVVLDWFAEALGLPEAFRSDGPGGGGHGPVQDEVVEPGQGVRQAQ